MNTETAKALQVVLFTFDNEAGELPIQDYLTLMQQLKSNLEERIKNIEPEVKVKINNLK